MNQKPHVHNSLCTALEFLQEHILQEKIIHGSLIWLMLCALGQTLQRCCAPYRYCSLPTSIGVRSGHPYLPGNTYGVFVGHQEHADQHARRMLSAIRQHCEPQNLFHTITMQWFKIPGTPPLEEGGGGRVKNAFGGGGGGGAEL